jgi:hypothetical protein
LQAFMATAPLEGLVTRYSATGAELDRVAVKVPEAVTVVNVSEAHSPVTASHPKPSGAPSLRPFAPK